MLFSAVSCCRKNFCRALAALGFGEWLKGHAGPGILLAVMVELALGLAFFQTKRVSVRWKP
jgi:hypothetical protein